MSAPPSAGPSGESAVDLSGVKAPILYAGGAPFIKFSPDGGSFAFYPNGRMAVAFEKMGAGYYVFFYADNAEGTTLCAFDPFGCGYAAFANGKPRLTSRKQGGVYIDQPTGGKIAKSWSTSKPLREPIEFDLTDRIAFKFKNRTYIWARFTSQGLSHEYEFGELQQMAEDSYLSKSIGTVKMGPERGKKILDIDKVRLAQAANRARREAAGGMKELDGAKKGMITQDYMQLLPELKSVVASTEALQASVASGAWNVEVFNAKQTLIDTLSEQLPTLSMSLEMDPGSKRLEGMPATDPETLKKMLEASKFDGAVLPLSAAIKGASGRFRPDHGNHYRTPRKRLRELKSTTYDDYLKSMPKEQLAVVCCMAGWLPQCRRVEPVLELVNGENAGGGGGGGGGGAQARFQLLKFDMSESRYLKERYNISTLPMYLMYLGGKLAYAGSTLNGFGTGKDDLKKQVDKTLADAQRGAFLPDDYKFGATDNNLVSSFGATLNSTSTKLATAAR